MNPKQRILAESALIVAVSAALVWLGGAGAVADHSPPQSSSVGDRSRSVGDHSRSVGHRSEPVAERSKPAPQVPIKPKGPVQTGGWFG